MLTKAPARKMPHNIHDARDVTYARWHRGLRTIPSRAKAGRDAICPSLAHPQTGSAPVARAARCARRVHACCDRSEPTSPRELRRPTATTRHSEPCARVRPSVPTRQSRRPHGRTTHREDTD